MKGWDKHLYTEAKRGGGQTIHVGDGDDDVEGWEEEDLSKGAGAKRADPRQKKTR